MAAATALWQLNAAAAAQHGGSGLARGWRGSPSGSMAAAWHGQWQWQRYVAAAALLMAIFAREMRNGNNWRNGSKAYGEKHTRASGWQRNMLATKKSGGNKMAAATLQ